MRNRFIAEIERRAETDSRIVVMTADLGYSVLDGFREKFPDRFVNVGICEQNMASMAAGLALSGYRVFTYSIGNFPVMRCLEQLRNDVCYHNADVTVVAVGGGFAYGQLGMSHHATEDLAITRSLPGMKVYVPADPVEAELVAGKVCEDGGPAYVRLAKRGEPCLHEDARELDVSRILELRKGDDVAVIATGSILSEALRAADSLAGEGIRIGVYNCITLKPFDKDGFMSLARRYSKIVSLEEHNVIGGLGGCLSECLAEMTTATSRPVLHRMGLMDEYCSVVGSNSFLRSHYAISAADIVRVVKNEI